MIKNVEMDKLHSEATQTAGENRVHDQHNV